MKIENIEKYIKLMEYSMRHKEFFKGANRDIEKDGSTRAIEHNKTIFLNELQRQMKAQDKAEVELDKESLERVRAEIYNFLQK